jgi:hypothetical protein
MSDYRIGSIITMAPVYSGIIKEFFWCQDCHKAGKDSNFPVYLVIWHSILVAAEWDTATAELKLVEIDRLDLMGWLDEAQLKERRWKARFWSLYNDINRWQEHLREQATPKEVDPEENSRRTLMREFFSFPPEILESPDPLAALLESHKSETKNEESERE